ncbi:serine/threonine protein kinase [Lentzea tibetensis]|uniref:non-specific serine/threonine protein kinase n=1 Tax=Lentzea tibetensis TaxID=2591470 RepID=A0A563EG60_9PSEU|nr:serine/threonine-protein kinase [Lentzea tibetensis]TWP45197.1 serine/threonine protein kinase [Lentzea tibetensis]
MTDDGRLVAGRYRLGQRIGSGAMGIVWTAHDERLHRTIAIKQLLLQPGLAAADTDEAKRRAMREGRIAARLQHPHAIAVYDVAEDDGQPWLVMEYLPSKSLSTVLSERGTLPPLDVASIGMQVASALAAAHIAGITHRDIKPGNVLLGDEGTVKITDFGISRATGDVTVTATGMLAGTPAYLAPEVAKGYDPGSPSDVFSLGSTLYAAVEGTPPFGLSENTIALLHQVAAGKVTPPRNAGPMTALLMRLLRADPEERPTMAEARDGLAAVANGKAAPAFTPAVVAPMNPPSWRGAPVSSPAGPTREILPPKPHHQPQPQHQGNMPNPTRVDLRTPPRPTPQPMNGRPAAAPQYSSSRPGGKEPKSKRSTMVTALAIVIAAAVGIMIASLISGNGDDNNNTANGSTPTGSEQTQQQQPSSKSKPAGPKAGEWTTQPTPDDMENMLREYFQTVTDNPEEGWTYLNESFQGKVSGGFSGYQNWWKNIDKAEIVNAQYDGNFYWNVEVKYTKKDGSSTVEPKGYSFQWASPNLLISAESSLGPARQG